MADDDYIELTEVVRVTAISPEGMTFSREPVTHMVRRSELAIVSVDFESGEMEIVQQPSGLSPRNGDCVT